MAEAKQGRRDEGDGSISQRKSDGRSVGSPRLSDGIRQPVYRANRQGAKRKLEQTQREAEHGALLASEQQRLAEYLEDWLSTKASTLKKSTASHYRTNVSGRILPALGQVPLQTLTTRHIQGFLTDMVEEGRSAGFIRHLHTVLSLALEQAIKWRLIASNPCKGGILPRHEHTESRLGHDRSKENPA